MEGKKAFAGDVKVDGCGTNGGGGGKRGLDMFSAVRSRVKQGYWG